MKGARYFIKTLGCKANWVDTHQIEKDLQTKGWLPASSAHDPEIALYVVNSCTVTDAADRQSKKEVTLLKRMNPQAKVVFTGCSADVSPTEALKTQGVDWVIGNIDKKNFSDLIQDHWKDASGGAVLGSAQGYSEMRSHHPIDREWPLPLLTDEGLNERAWVSKRTRSFLKIQEGCDAFCTFCIIPYGRGPARSLPAREIIQKINELVGEGTQEVILTGTNIGDFGVDWNHTPALEMLCDQILSQTKLRRLRLSSLDPTEITDPILNLIETSQGRLCPHLHVSLQSPHPKILKLMKRRYTGDQAFEGLRRIASLSEKLDRRIFGGIFVGMDLITGFPGESDEDFEWTQNILRKLYWTRLHVFPYSERQGTPATRLPGIVPQSVRKHRAKTLNALSLERMSGWAHAILSRGRILHEVLMESRVRGPDGTHEWISGYTPDYIRVLVRSEESSGFLRNRRISARPVSVFRNSAESEVSLLAELIEPARESTEELDYSQDLHPASHF